MFEQINIGSSFWINLLISILILVIGFWISKYIKNWFIVCLKTTIKQYRNFYLVLFILSF